MIKVIVGVVFIGLVGLVAYSVSNKSVQEGEMEKAAMETKLKEESMLKEQALLEEKMMEEKEMMNAGREEVESTMVKSGDTGTPPPAPSADGKVIVKTDNRVVKNEDVAMDKKEDMMKQTEVAVMSAGTYEPYDESKLSRATTGDVVLFFRASWCPGCKGLEADIKAHLGDIPNGVTILDVNYDTETELKKKYGVTYQHTLVQVDASGNQIAKWSGSPSLSALTSEIQ